MASQLLYAALLLGLCVLIHVTGTVAMARAFQVCGASTAGVPTLSAGAWSCREREYVLDVRSADLGGRLCCAQRDRRSRRSCLLLHCDLYDGRLRRRRAAPRLARLGGLRGSSRDLALRLVDRPAHRLDPTDDEGVDLQTQSATTCVRCCWLIILFAGSAFHCGSQCDGDGVVVRPVPYRFPAAYFSSRIGGSLSGIDPGVVARRCAT